MVIQAGWGNTRSALLELADVGVDEEMKNKVRNTATEALAENSSLSKDINVRAVQGVKSGQNYLMDVELGVPGTWTIEQTRNVEDIIRKQIGAKVRGVKKVRVRFVKNSSQEPDFLDEFIPGDPSVPSIQISEPDHDHEHNHGHEHEHLESNGSAKKTK